MNERPISRICPECGQPLRAIEEGVAIEGRPRWQCEGPECHEFPPSETSGWFAGTLSDDDPGKPGS